MGSTEKTIRKVLSGSSDANIAFGDLCKVLDSLGFRSRVKGSHHIFAKDGLPEILNLQPRDSKAKPYQVRQVRNLLLKYKLVDSDG